LLRTRARGVAREDRSLLRLTDVVYTSVANPAVTIARALTDNFAGIRPMDAPGFVLAQLVGLLLALALLPWSEWTR
jgi:glycerol uptake facilitator-like aquaporin